MAIQDFTAGQVLTAAQMDNLQANDYNQTVSTKTANYTLVAADKGTRVVMNAAGATTITVNTSLFSAGDTLQLQNIGAGVTTVTAGTATVSSAGPLAIPQYGSGTLYFTSAGVSIYFPSAVTIPPASSGLTFISSTTCVNGSATQINNCFSSTYDNYTIQFTGVTGSTYGTGVQARLGSGGTPDTSSVYYTGSSTWGSNLGYWGIMNVPNTSGTNMSFTMTIYVPNQARPTSGTGEYLYYSSSVALNGFYNNTSTQYTDFTCINTDLTGGSIKVYGWQKS
tara:strand:+ start:481 stop:1320 length:840 start_codon:yes stop_codon:yes gene_type:complete